MIGGIENEGTVEIFLNFKLESLHQELDALSSFVSLITLSRGHLSCILRFNTSASHYFSRKVDFSEGRAMLLLLIRFLDELS